MVWVLLMGIITVLSVFIGVKQKRMAYLLIPLGSILMFMLVKIIMVPLPFMETVRFIFDIRG
ncbi:hypothetical protein [Radiobacillus deserti]|uniref:Uncharacterized protein n=1 Tax=Radiobacillus deserti TaxID=2594883 RepID=A0A516KI15_9BACI|nr:hypothetical protein [Radiobacillus deserti]QDP41048.1 hypothetical protein FN924_13110 [Radiobacillus deserti]